MALLLRVYHFLLTRESTVKINGIKTSAESDKNILVKNLAAMSSSSESEDATPSKRKNYDMHFKLEVVKYAEKYNKSKAAKIKKVPRSCVKDWMKQKAQLEAHLKMSCSTSSSKRLQGAGRPLKDKDFDEILINWVRQQRQKKLRVSRAMIQREALTLSHNENFSASNGWLEKFLLRHNLVSRRQTTTCQKKRKEKRKATPNPETCEHHQWKFI
ncbi:unnamed protein product [Clavelina lepadiformis]|uniref:HTH CENPB-type domain-containing protein n=1 Tax=Clavelina lepadiformis TaxID=159417 RepID=A0ABP0G1N0_CLALP